MTIRLLIRLDANQDIGHGHAVRLAGLVAELKTDVAPIVLGDVFQLPGVLSGVERHAATGVSAGGMTKTIAALNPDAVLVDLPLRSERPWAEFRRAGVPLIAIDDEGGEIDADLVINGTVLNEYHQYSGLPARARCLVGPRYALLRPSFAATPWRGPAGRWLAIIVGSGERARQWAHALGSGGLDDLRLDHADMVIGASFPDTSNLRAEAARHGITVHQGLNAHSLADLLAGASAALMTGGMVVYEALAIGVPVVAFPQIPNLVPELRWFAEAGCISDLGFERGMHMGHVRFAVDHLLSDTAAAQAQSSAGRRIIDGQGMKRAAEAIDEILC